MNEPLIAAGWHQLCDTLLAVRKSGDWRRGYKSFDDYVVKRWSLSKTRGKLFCDFATFSKMCRDYNLPLADSPDNIQPIINLKQGRWMDVWAYCLNHDAKTADSIKALFAHSGIVGQKKIPKKVRDANAFKRATRTLAELDTGQVIDESGPDSVGRYVREATDKMIDADQRIMDEKWQR